MAMQDLTEEEVTAIVREHVPNWEDYETEDDCIADNMDILFEYLWEDEDMDTLSEYEFDEELIDEQGITQLYQWYLRCRTRYKRSHLGLQVHLVHQLYCLGYHGLAKASSLPLI